MTPAAFDPASLNDPAARSNWNAGVVVEVPLFNAEAWAGRSAARAGARAAAATADWTAAATRLQVVQAYYDARLASETVLTLEVAEATAAAHVQQANSRLEQGMVTRSDLLLAQVRAGEIRAQLIGARAQAGLARRQLALVLGVPADTAFAMPDSLPSAEQIRAVAELLAPVPLTGAPTWRPRRPQPMPRVATSFVPRGGSSPGSMPSADTTGTTRPPRSVGSARGPSA